MFKKYIRILGFAISLLGFIVFLHSAFNSARPMLFLSLDICFIGIVLSLTSLYWYRKDYISLSGFVLSVIPYLSLLFLYVFY